MQSRREQVLSALADADEGVSGPRLAEQLGVSRAAVWKHVEALRGSGFEIESADDGYRLTAVPEFGGEAVEFGLDAPFEIEYHETLASTNDRARELAEDGQRDVVVLADEQTGGRGRLDRAWSSPPGGVWLSIVCSPGLPPAHAPVYTLAAAVATTRAAREAGVDAVIKWPNDVLVRDDADVQSGASTQGPESEYDGRKLAGILTEMRGEADRVGWLVVGIGVNADVARTALPPTATSIREQVGDVDRRAFTQRLLETFDGLRRDPEAILPAWREHAVTLSRRVCVNTPGGEVVGEAVDVEFPGGLVVETDERRVRVSAGDCEHLRSAE